MSLRTCLPLIAVVLLGCGGTDKTSNEPTTAKEKQRREARANGDEKKEKGSKSWGGWRYKGDRNSCFFQVSGKCFKTENAACQAARCAKPKKCNVAGGGPALVTCK